MSENNISDPTVRSRGKIVETSTNKDIIVAVVVEVPGSIYRESELAAGSTGDRKASAVAAQVGEVNVCEPTGLTKNNKSFCSIIAAYNNIIKSISVDVAGPTDPLAALRAGDMSKDFES